MAVNGVGQAGNVSLQAVGDAVGISIATVGGGIFDRRGHAVTRTGCLAVGGRLQVVTTGVQVANLGVVKHTVVGTEFVHEPDEAVVIIVLTPSDVRQRTRGGGILIAAAPPVVRRALLPETVNVKNDVTAGFCGIARHTNVVPSAVVNGSSTVDPLVIASVRPPGAKRKFAGLAEAETEVVRHTANLTVQNRSRIPVVHTGALTGRVDPCTN